MRRGIVCAEIARAGGRVGIRNAPRPALQTRNRSDLADLQTGYEPRMPRKGTTVIRIVKISAAYEGLTTYSQAGISPRVEECRSLTRHIGSNNETKISPAPRDTSRGVGRSKDKGEPFIFAIKNRIPPRFNFSAHIYSGSESWSKGASLPRITAPRRNRGNDRWRNPWSLRL